LIHQDTKVEEYTTYAKDRKEADHKASQEMDRLCDIGKLPQGGAYDVTEIENDMLGEALDEQAKIVIEKIKEKSPKFYDSLTLATIHLLENVCAEENNGLFTIISHENGQLIINNLDTKIFAQALLEFFNDVPEYKEAFMEALWNQNKTEFLNNK
jgi:hypothetical protein